MKTLLYGVRSLGQNLQRLQALDSINGNEGYPDRQVGDGSLVNGTAECRGLKFITRARELTQAGKDLSAYQGIRTLKEGRRFVLI